MTTPITIAYGDEAARESMEAALYVLREAGAKLSIETIDVGARIYAMRHPPGILPSAFDTLARTRILLKGHTQTPMIEGYLDVNDVIRAHFADQEFALFEAADESFPAALQAAIRLLAHINAADLAQNIQRAWEAATEAGLAKPTLTERLFGQKLSETMQWAEAVCERL